MTFDTRKKTFYFPTKTLATEFKTALKQYRLIGTPRLRKTLASRVCGGAKYTDTRHRYGYSITARAWSFADEIDIAKLVKQCGAISKPGSTDR